MAESDTSKSPRRSPLQPPAVPPVEIPRASQLPPTYEKEWDDAEALAGEILEKREHKKEEARDK